MEESIKTEYILRTHEHSGYDGSKNIFRVRKVAITKTYKDFSTAALTNDVNIFTLGQNNEILSAYMNVDTAFAGTSTLTISMGKDSAETGLLTAQDAKTAGLKLAIGTDFTTNRAVYSTSAATTIQLRATATVNNLDSLSAGQITAYITYYA